MAEHEEIVRRAAEALHQRRIGPWTDHEEQITDILRPFFEQAVAAARKEARERALEEVHSLAAEIRDAYDEGDDAVRPYIHALNAFLSGLDALRSKPEEPEPAVTIDLDGVEPENGWHQVWHRGCPERGPMRWRRDHVGLLIEDGTSLRLYECLGCGRFLYAGVDARRFIVTRPCPQPWPARTSLPEVRGTGHDYNPYDPS